jgi:hypothetical protein
MVLLGRINRFALNRIARPKRHCNTFFCKASLFLLGGLGVRFASRYTTKILVAQSA